MRKDNIVENYHGTLVADPYRWLEDSNDPDTQAWVKEQNRITRQHLDIPLREELKRRLEELWDYPQYELPLEAGGRLFFQKTTACRTSPCSTVRSPAASPLRCWIPILSAPTAPWP